MTTDTAINVTKIIIQDGLIFPEEYPIKEQTNLLPLFNKNEILESGIFDEIELFSSEMQQQIESLTKTALENNDF